MKIYHIVPNINKINYGVWKVVLDNILFNTKFDSYMIVLEKPKVIPDEINMIIEKVKYLKTNDVLNFLLKEDCHDDILVTHGCWTGVTYIGNYLSKKGFRWIMYPHGMLEPWALKNNYWKKSIYFKFIEERRISNAHIIVAVGKPEQKNIRKLFPNNKCVHIPNGIKSEILRNKNYDVFEFTFVARLHYKKGVVELIKAWLSSSLLNKNIQFKLNIAGPDEGELNKIKVLINGSDNIKILGPIYGEKKKELLRRSHFFVLPSYSEGFPTSIVEAMTFGCIPIITEGCNFPEINNKCFTLLTEPNIQKLARDLEKAANIDSSHFVSLSEQAKTFIDENYNIQSIVDRQNLLYQELINSNDKKL